HCSFRFVARRRGRPRGRRRRRANALLGLLISIAGHGLMVRSVPVAIQNPRAPFGFWGFAMVAMRTRKTGLVHEPGIPAIMPEKRALPFESIGTSGVS